MCVRVCTILQYYAYIRHSHEHAKRFAFLHKNIQTHTVVHPQTFHRCILFFLHRNKFRMSCMCVSIYKCTKSRVTSFPKGDKDFLTLFLAETRFPSSHYLFEELPLLDDDALNCRTGDNEVRSENNSNLWSMNLIHKKGFCDSNSAEMARNLSYGFVKTGNEILTRKGKIKITLSADDVGQNFIIWDFPSLIDEREILNVITLRIKFC